MSKLKHESTFFQTFCVLWGAAALYHYAASSALGNSAGALVLNLLSVLLVIQPGVRLLLIFCVVHLVQFVFELPAVSNHWMLMAFGNLIVLGSALVLRFSQKGISAENLIHIARRPFQACLVVLYFFAVFHKLNTDYLFSDQSCALFLVSSLPWPLSALADLFPPILLTAGSLVIETLIPVLLINRRTAIFGALLGVVFHTVLSSSAYQPYFNFSSVLMIFYLMFQEEHQLKGAWSSLSKRVSSAFPNAPKTTARALRAGFCLLIYLTMFLQVLFWLWSLQVLLVVMVLLLMLRTGKAPAEERVSAAHLSPAPILLLLPALFFINGLFPYFGLKTETSLAMYSNLRTEGTLQNHLFMPAVDIFGYQRDLVEVLESDHYYFKQIVGSPFLVPFFEFHRDAQMFPEASVRFRRDGREEFADPLGEHPAVREKIPYWKRKFLYFRSVDTREHAVCQH